MRLPALLPVTVVLGVFCLYLVVRMPSPAPGTVTPVVHYSLRNLPSGGLPTVSQDMLKMQNESADWMISLHQRYGPVQYAGVAPRDTSLTTEETRGLERCVASAKANLARSNSKFWGANEHIRTKNHTYLKREDAVLIEVGGNQGGDAERFVKLFNPRYVILEPLEEYANILRQKFKDNSRVTVINLGLGEKTEVVMVKMDGNNACATSKFSGAGGTTPLYVVNATEFLLKLGLGVFEVDLLTLNCEGCEFETLEMVLSTTLVNRLRNIQFATHSTIPVQDAVRRYCRIQQLLARTHRPVYHYPLIWESWRRRDLP